MNIGELITRDETMHGTLCRLRNDNVLISLESLKERLGYTGVLELPDTTVQPTSDHVGLLGRVKMVGPKVRDVAVGDRVAIEADAGDQLWIDGVEHRIVRVRNVLGVLDG